MPTIDINCDMGESFGKYVKGRDSEVIQYVTTANIAGGFHGGDPHVMNDTVQLAAAHDVGIGVHPGLPDRLGFGRRRWTLRPRKSGTTSYTSWGRYKRSQTRTVCVSNMSSHTVHCTRCSPKAKTMPEPSSRAS